MARKKDKLGELRELSDTNLVKEMEETYRQLFLTRLQLSTRQLANTSVPRNLRRRIAQIKTIQRERQFAAARVAMGAK